MAGGYREGADGPADDDADLDAQWAELTKRLGPLSMPPQSDGDFPTEAPPSTTPPENTPARRRDYGPRDYGVEEPEDELEFVPPDPQPIIPGRSRNTLPVAGALLGPLAILSFLVFWPTAPPVAYLAGLTISIASLIVLWWRLPHRKDDDDDGAVV